MKNLGKTIDRILKIDPTLEEKLLAIKNKWRRFPSKRLSYWKELLDFLNSDSVVTHPKRSEIKNVLTSTSIPVKRHHFYSFEECLPSDHILGVIPENLLDKLRRHDRQSLEAAKMRVEVEVTRNQQLLAKVSRREALLELNTKKIWIILRDHFNLWGRQSNYSIKKNKDFIVLVDTSAAPTFMGPNIVKMDQNTLRQFMQFLGQPPEDGNPQKPE